MLSYRSATDGDKYFLRLVCLNTSKLYQYILPGAFDKQADKFMKEGLPSTYSINIIELTNEPIGFIGTTKLDAATLYLTALYFLSSYQRKGYGELILKQLISRSQKEGYQEIVLLVHEKAHWAISFYSKLGFKCISNVESEIKAYKDSKLKPYAIPSTMMMAKSLVD
ncbi:GNAT family N-acetyltransferase [Alkaliphilus transvaalensis]|uniref:GNAT family N-acetyltransferase n=1 Tax=Alkaliphilus transvaalensis TaxID=114628 RepID=UPI000551537F|nr:GNAT family N-acetyltransferase [Alkaliphilus transvaalensis]